MLTYLFDRYELDEENLTLTRDGQRLPLEPKALSVLLLMVRSPGKLLKKDAILAAVWKNTIVEESSLSRAVTLLRKQLGDDPRNPTFIETVPTLGYRFIAKVDVVKPVPISNASSVDRGPEPAEPTAAAPAPAPATTSAPAPIAEPVSALATTPTLARANWPRYAWISAVLFLLLAAVITYRLAIRPQPTVLREKSIVLADFANLTGEPVFDGTLRQGMIVQLEQSPLFSLVADQRIRAVLALMGQPGDVRLTPVLSRDICQRLGGAAVIEGSVARLGDQYVLGLRATDCNGGQVLDTEQVQAPRKEDVLQALGQIASKFRTRVGESLASTSKLNTPLAEATTPSLEALKAYSEANVVLTSNGSAAAIPLFERATAIDPEFAIAHAMLGRLYGDVGQEVRSEEQTAEAYKFRNRASEKERLFIVASYEMQVMGDLEKAQETCDAWERIYPDDRAPYGFRAGVIFRVFGRYGDAVAMARIALALDPDFAMGYHLLITNDIASGRLGDAKTDLDRAIARYPEFPYFLLDRYRLAFLKSNRAEMEQLAASAARLPSTEVLLSSQVASALAYSGQLQDAREIAQRAVFLAVQLDRRESAARIEAGAALREALFGNYEPAARHAAAAQKLSNGRDAVYGEALALAFARDSSSAAALADDLEKRFPADTSVRFHYIPTIRAQIALNHNDPESAIELLQTSTVYEFGTPTSGFLGSYGALYSTFVRGQAWLALKHGPQAEAEFQKIIQRPELLVGDPIGPLARLGLGRALLESGDRDGAEAAYASLFELWKNADPDLPILKVARAEQARLTR